MKRKFFIPSMALLLVVAGCQVLSISDQNLESTDSKGQATNARDPFDLEWENRTIFRTNLIPSEQKILSDSEGMSDYHIDVEIADDLNSLTGQLEVRYTNNEETSLEELYLRLFPNIMAGELSISNILLDGERVETTSELSDSAVRIPLSTPLDPGESFILEMDFETIIPEEMGGNYGLFGHFEDLLVLQEFFPIIPVFDDEGWNVEVPPPHGDVTYLDPSYFVVRVGAPAELTLLTSGVEIDRVIKDDRQSLTFAAGPARDFYLAASENFEVQSVEIGGTQVNSFAFPGREEGASLALQFSLNALKSFNERFGPYPYTELDVVGTTMQALGMEYPGVIAISDKLYDPDHTLYGAPSSVILESTIAHEVAHQWFYNTVANDQIDEPWMDEAIVQYATGLYHQDQYGDRGMQGYRQSWVDRWDRVEKADIPIGLPSEDYDETAYGAIIYGRGPLFLDALAELMGQSVFDSFLRDYYIKNKWGIGTGDSFRDLAEGHCNCDLQAIFEEWVYE